MERIAYQEIPNGMFENLMKIENFIKESSVELNLLELIRLRVSQMNGCAYCVDMHHKELKHLGETDLRLSLLCVWKETPYFTEKERATLAFAEKLNRINTEPIPNDVYSSLESHFDKNEICFLALAISQINTWNRLMKTFQITPGNYQV